MLNFIDWESFSRLMATKCTFLEACALASLKEGEDYMYYDGGVLLNSHGVQKIEVLIP